MKTSLLLSFLTLSLLLRVSPIYGQTYNAGVGSGTGGDHNVHVGYNAGRLSTGSENSFVGSLAGNSNTTGNSNSFIGHGAGYKNTTGSYNSFIGVGAGLLNTTASNNSFFGNGAGYYNTSGYFNSFVGNEAGFKNTIGYYNSFVGGNAGYSTTSGHSNSFLGVSSGYANTTGNSNSYVGFEAGMTNQAGSANSLLGYRAGYNTKGSQNVFIGYQAGNTNTSGSNNVALGYQAGPSTGSLTNAIAIGHRARVSVSNALVLGSISGVNDASATIKVGIGTTSPAYLLHANGSAAKPGGGSWTAASDKRLKQNIKDFTGGLAILEKVRPVSFRYNGKAGLPTEKEYVGVIAQEMQKIAPYMVGEFTYQDSTGAQEKYLDYDATALTYILVNAVKEQQQLLLGKDEEVAQLKAENAEIKQELAAIKALLLKYIPGAGNEQARLGQNVPNPASQLTTIPYRLPLSANSAFIKVYSSTGQEVKSFDITGKTQGEVTLSAGMLTAGTYVYSLFVDGVKIDSKKLVLTH
jgi:hypothetical protein